MSDNTGITKQRENVKQMSLCWSIGSKRKLKGCIYGEEPMNSYECDYCGEALCPEICPETKAAHLRWINSKEFKVLHQSRHTALNKIKGEVGNVNT